MRIFLFVMCYFFALWLCPCSSDVVFLRRNEAHRVLRLQKRSNQFLEEIKPGNLERECYEETCSFEEAREIFKAQEKTTEFWFHYKDLNPCKVNPCQNGGICQQYHYEYVCLCPPMFTGKLCDTEKFECWYKNGGCQQYCQDEAESQDVTCSCAEGYTLDEKGKTCSASVLFPCGLTTSSMRSLQDDSGHFQQGDSTRSRRHNPEPSPQDSSTHSLNSTCSLQDNTTSSLQDESMSSLKHDSTQSLQENCTCSIKHNSTHSLQDNSTLPVLGNSTHSMKDNYTRVLQDNCLCSFQDNATRSIQDVPMSMPQDNSTSSPTADFTSTPRNDFIRTLVDNSRHLTPKITKNAPLKNFSSNRQRAQEEDGLKLLDGNIFKEDWDESTSFGEDLEDNNTRIVGGVRCHLGSCPWQVLIRNYQGRDFCGGSLISSRWVLSASHCFEDVNPHHVTIGDFDKLRRDQDEQKIAVLEFYMHPHYNSEHFDNDIALLYLRSPAQFNGFAIPICLPSPSLARMLLQEGETGMVSGWGSTRNMGPSSRFLLSVKLPVVSQKTCIQSTPQIITGSMFCAGYNVEARDSCKGDSGGPFAMTFHNTWYLMGVISWGEGCAEEGKYGVYTRVSDYIQWIKDTIEAISQKEEFQLTAE